MKNPSAPSYEGSSHFLGASARRGGALIAPALAQHVANKMRDEAAIMKEKRKAMEAKQGSRTSAPGKASAATTALPKAGDNK